MTDTEFIENAKRACIKDFKEYYSHPDHYKYVAEMLWYCYTLGNYKAQFLVHDADEIINRCYDATYVNSEGELTIDEYKHY